MGLSNGLIYDRTKEHLVTADLGVVRIRRRLLEAARRVKAGQRAELADLRCMAAPDVDLPVGTNWRGVAPLHYDLARHDLARQPEAARQAAAVKLEKQT